LQDAVQHDKLVLKSRDEVLLTDFTVIVGGNATGKSTLLFELFQKINDVAPDRGQVYRWLEEVPITEATPVQSAQLLLDSLSEEVDSNTLAISRYSSRARKGLYEDVALAPEQHRQLLEIVAGAVDGTAILKSVAFRKPFFAYHSCDNRLSVAQTVNLNPANGRAGDPLNVLYRDPTLRDKLATRIREQFSLELSLLDHIGTQLELRLGDEPVPANLLAEKNRQQRFTKIETWKREHTIGFQESGHGIRAMGTLMLSLFDPINSVLLIDEPELFLYPTHKRALGRTLAQLAREEHKQVIVATHDANFLQGVLDTVGDATVLRLSLGGNRNTRVLKRCDLGRALGFGPTKNQREYLNALFYERCVILEGSSDRAFYEGVRELYGVNVGQDIGFVVSSGKGGALNIGSLCQTVGVPYAYVFDFDILLPADVGKITTALTIQNKAWDETAGRRIVETAISEVAGTLAGTAEATRVQALKTLKRRGINAIGLTPATVLDLRRIMTEIKALGIHVLARGELEDWVPAVEGKPRFSEEALDYLNVNKAEGRDVAGFLGSVFEGFVVPG
jgi:predicted ATPase